MWEVPWSVRQQFVMQRWYLAVKLHDLEGSHRRQRTTKLSFHQQSPVEKRTCLYLEDVTRDGGGGGGSCLPGRYTASWTKRLFCWTGLVRSLVGALAVLLGLHDLWTWRKCDPSKRPERLAQQRSVTSLKTFSCQQHLIKSPQFRSRESCIKSAAWLEIRQNWLYTQNFDRTTWRGKISCKMLKAVVSPRQILFAWSHPE